MRFWGFTKCLNDKSRTRYLCDHVFRLHQGHHQKRYVGMDDREHEVYFDWERFCLYMVAQQIDPWSMMSEVWEGEQIAKGYWKDGYITGRWSLRGRLSLFFEILDQGCYILSMIDQLTIKFRVINWWDQKKLINLLVIAISSKDEKQWNNQWNQIKKTFVVCVKAKNP